MRRFAIIPATAFVHELVQRDSEDMDKLLESEHKNILGIPQFYDYEGRVWPNPVEGCIVAEEQRIKP